MTGTQIRGRLGINTQQLRTLYWLSRRVLKGNEAAAKKLSTGGSGSLFQLYRCDPSSFTLDRTPKQIDLHQLGLSPEQAEIADISAMHLGVNCEHIAPHPVLIAFATNIFPGLVIHARDFGRGLGKYLDCPGQLYSTRSYELQQKLGLEEQGNGILLTLNQVLNGCQGSVVIESSGQKVLLWKTEDGIMGKIQFGSTLPGTSFSLFFPFFTKWRGESTGWDPHDLPPSLEINFCEKAPKPESNTT